MRQDELPRLCEFIVNLYGVREMDWLPEIPKCLVSGHLSLSYYSRGTVGKGGKNEKLIFFLRLLYSTHCTRHVYICDLWFSKMPDLLFSQT